jgi:hypothetical protein
MHVDLPTLEAELQSVRYKIEAGWWRFCRCKRANPVPAELYRRRAQLEREIRAIRRGERKP